MFVHRGNGTKSYVFLQIYKILVNSYFIYNTINLYEYMDYSFFYPIFVIRILVTVFRHIKHFILHTLNTQL